MKPPILKLITQPDSSQLAGLANQLGYPSTAQQVAARLAGILARPDQAVYTAEVDGQIAGWVHVYACPTVESELYAEIGGLVVDQDLRGRGLGKALMAQAEAWAQEHDIHEIRLRSNMLRTEAHLFYAAIGYEKLKSQFTFRKKLK